MNDALLWVTLYIALCLDQYDILELDIHAFPLSSTDPGLDSHTVLGMSCRSLAGNDSTYGLLHR